MKLKGLLMIDSFDNKPYIRQYTKDGEFRDIYIRHDDLNIEIDDNSAQIYKDSEGDEYIDYTESILGITGRGR